MTYLLNHREVHVYLRLKSRGNRDLAHFFENSDQIENTFMNELSFTGAQDYQA